MTMARNPKKNTDDMDIDDTDVDVEMATERKETPQTDDDDEFNVEVIDDISPDDKPRRAEDAAPNLPSDEEIESYSDRVQKRIKQLKFEYEEERRHREEAARLREEAITYAQQVHTENQRLRTQLEQGQGQVVEQAKARVTSELEAAKRNYKQAYESGDADALLEAQTHLTRAQNDLYRLESYRPRPVQSQVKQPQQAPKPQQPPELDDRQRKWLKDNSWFGKNEEMTGYAYGLHERLVKSGVDPNSERYYNTINETVRKRFPEEFQSEDSTFEEVEVGTRKPATVVAPAGRSTSKKPRTVKLTSTQVSLAKRLGLKPEQYAAQLMKEQRNV